MTLKKSKNLKHSSKNTFSSVQFSHVQLLVIPWTAARQASLCITNSQSLLKLMSIELVMPSSHLILCHPLLLPPSIFPSIRVFSNESALHILCCPLHLRYSQYYLHWSLIKALYIKKYSQDCEYHFWPGLS